MPETDLKAGNLQELKEMENEKPPVVELKVDGKIYGGWKNVHITRSIEQMSGTFDLETSERWPGQPDRSPLKPGQRCQVLLDDVPVITGRVDTVMVDYDSQKHGIRVAGRDKTGSLVDCSAIHKTGQWHNVTLEQIANNLLAPFLIKVIVDVDVGKVFPSYNIQEGETVFECLERAARMRGVLLTSNFEGNLVITRAGRNGEGAVLKEGVNIKAARAEFSWKDRFSEYTAKGLGRLGADGDTAHSAPSATIGDPVISYYRPLVLLADGHTDNSALVDRVAWERNVRQGRGGKGSITVQGWKTPGGWIWTPNSLVSITSPLLWLKEATMLIVGCTYSLDDQGGSLTELAIAQPEAFQLLKDVAGLPVNEKLFGKIKTKEQRERREKYEDWSPY